jgi:hypothetical protein
METGLAGAFASFEDDEAAGRVFGHG